MNERENGKRTEFQVQVKDGYTKAWLFVQGFRHEAVAKFKMEHWSKNEVRPWRVVRRDVTETVVAEVAR